MPIIPTENFIGEMELQEVVPRLQIPEATIHRWIGELKLEKRLVRQGSRTICLLPPETIARLQHRKIHGARRTVAANVPPPGREAIGLPAAPVPPEAPAPDSTVSNALHEALERAEALQMEVDALRAARPAAADPQPPKIQDRAIRDPDPILRAAGLVARAAGLVAYRTLWLVARVFLPREISRALLGLRKSDYIGWQEA